MTLDTNLSEQAGRFRLSILLGGFAVFATLVLAACGGGGKEPSAAEIVRRSVQATSAVTSFHFTLDIRNVPTSATGLALQAAEGDVAVPDRLKAAMSGTLAGVPLTTTLIVIGGTAYLENPLTKTWQRLALGTSPVAFFDPAKGVLAVIKAASEVRKTGTEEVGGVSTYQLEGRVPAGELTPLLGNPSSRRSVAVTFWVGKDDFLLRRIRVDGPLSAKEPKAALRLIEVSRFDEEVSIQAPKESR